jgi:hypothetical protein
MKKIYYILSVTLLCASCGPTTVIQSDPYQPAPAAPVEEVSYQSFYDQLSPYGNWVNYPGYGYVWSPNAGPDFQPYATNVTGFTQMPAGPGRPIIIGVGHHFITAAGFMKMDMAGCGYPATNGHLHGLAGVEVEIIMDGHRWVRIFP